MKILIAVLLGTSPFVLHLAIVWSSPAFMALFIVFIAVGLLAGFARGHLPPWAIGLAALAALGFGGLALLDLGTAFRVAETWPILVYLGIAWIFGSSLLPGRMPLVERIARIVDFGDAMPARLVKYTRVLTWAWTLVCLGFALVSVLLAQFASQATWSLFTNVLSYVALAVFFLAEYPYRRWRYPETPPSNPLVVAARMVRNAPRFLSRQGREWG